MCVLSVYNCFFISIFLQTQAYEDGKDAHVPKPEMYAGQGDALVSDRMSNVIPKFVFRVVQST